MLFCHNKEFFSISHFASRFVFFRALYTFFYYFFFSFVACLFACITEQCIHSRTACSWHCEHAGFYVEVVHVPYINFRSLMFHVCV